MAAWSPEIANEFIRLAQAEGRALTQMQLQKLVYIAHGWNLAINGAPLTCDQPRAWAYGPVYNELRNALKQYGRSPVTQPIKNADYVVGSFDENPDAVAQAALSDAEKAVIGRVYRDYGKFHAFQLSALTHEARTPWNRVYNNGEGKDSDIPADMIRDHFVDLARTRQPA